MLSLNQNLSQNPSLQKIRSIRFVLFAPFVVKTCRTMATTQAPLCWVRAFRAVRG